MAKNVNNINKKITKQLIIAYTFNSLAHATNAWEFEAYHAKAAAWHIAKEIIDNSPLGDWIYSQQSDLIYFHNRKHNIQLSFHYGRHRKKPCGVKNMEWSGIKGCYGCAKLAKIYGINMAFEYNDTNAIFHGIQFDTIFKKEIYDFFIRVFSLDKEKVNLFWPQESTYITGDSTTSIAQNFSELLATLNKEANMD